MKSTLLIAAALGVALSAAPLAAQEHPEHPTDTPMTKEVELTKDSLADAIQSWVNDQSKLLGGYFLYYDAEARQPLALTLDHVHRERVASLGNDVYFACADFKEKGGKMYDIDVFMKDQDGELVPTDVSVHKVEGVPRYTWAEENGVWMKKPAK